MGFGIFDVIAGAFSIFSAIESRSEKKRAAKEAQAITDREVARKQTELERFRSKQRVAFARSGIKLDGTPTLVLDDTQTQGQLDIDLIRARGLQRVNSLHAQATQSGYDAKIGGVKLIPIINSLD